MKHNDIRDERRETRLAGPIGLESGQYLSALDGAAS
jgi:hypothetical protein